MASELEALLALHIRAENLPVPVREHVFHPERRWRLDFAWPEFAVACEVDGEVHRIKARFHADIEKHAALVLAGWTLLRVDGRAVRSGVAVDWLRRLLDRAKTRCVA